MLGPQLSAMLHRLASISPEERNQQQKQLLDELVRLYMAVPEALPAHEPMHVEIRGALSSAISGNHAGIMITTGGTTKGKSCPNCAFGPLP